MNQFLYQYRNARRAGKRGGGFMLALRWATLAALIPFLMWSLAFPQSPYPVVSWLGRNLYSTLGISTWLVPVFLAYGLLWTLRRGSTAGGVTLTAGCIIVTASAASLEHLGGMWMGASATGGAVGRVLGGGALRLFGPFGAALGCLSVGLGALQGLVGVRWTRGAAALARMIGDDYREWLRARGELEGKLASAPKAPVPSGDGGPLAAEPPEPRQRPAPKPGSRKSSRLPDISLLDPPEAGADRGRPSDAEVSAASAALERTLQNFNIETKVTGVSPGPVITRYELTPAPGVKVSSIVSLQKDIALAMEALAIRIVAPIPGKAAVGIELPNARPARVCLREILESRAIPPDAPALTFGVGLSADGDPVAANLQSMPHLLVAGVTGSGKSVLLHSLILSILFRARSDEVKFLLIDPKRLELTGYDGIPHLFDPTVPAERVSVLTSPKEAARALGAMVKLMERRYESFQAAGVRHIDGYNEWAAREGRPREFFAVIVIDELADLILAAQDQVEDSIQRLAQMARAVGIHLVLATQQPTVDVITGVIKANLPARIALQVTSGINSRVVLDETGAESLLGRGDLLYLAAGAPKPARCQGAYVSEEEIRRVVDHLRASGKAEYPLLDTMPQAAETDLASSGVEPAEFREACKLILARRRVSQDLLKSQFGSSARATNILSLLEVKGYIHKPEGSNRWEINYDLIESYLRNAPGEAPRS